MSTNSIRIALVLPIVSALLALAGCNSCKVTRCCVEAPQHDLVQVTQDLPPNAKPGECFVKVFVPEQFETSSETVLVREASEKLEVIPARYEWVDEKVILKEASTKLEVVPAEFATKTEAVQVDPGHSGWHMQKPPIVEDAQLLTNEMFCLVSHEPQFANIEKQVEVKPTTVREVTIPAEFQTIRVQKLIAPATTRRVPVPAEYTTVQKSFKTADSRVEWRKVACEAKHQAQAGRELQSQVVSANRTQQPLDCGPKPIE